MFIILYTTELRRIASTPNCSENDSNWKMFFIFLEKLRDHCNFNTNVSTDEDGTFVQPLLIRLDYIATIMCKFVHTIL